MPRSYTFSLFSDVSDGGWSRVEPYPDDRTAIDTARRLLEDARASGASLLCLAVGRGTLDRDDLEWIGWWYWDGAATPTVAPTWSVDEARAGIQALTASPRGRPAAR